VVKKDINGEKTTAIPLFNPSVTDELRGSITALDTTRPANDLSYDSHFMVWDWDVGTSTTITQVSGQYASVLCKVRCSTSALGTVCSKPSTGTGMTITVGGTASGLASDYIGLRECVGPAMSNSLIGKTVTFSWSINGVVSSRTFVWSSTSSTVAGGGNEIYISNITAGQVITVNWHKPEIGSKATPCYQRTQAAVEDDVKYFYERIYNHGIMPHGYAPGEGCCIYEIGYHTKARVPNVSGTINLLANNGFAEHAYSPHPVIAIDVGASVMGLKYAVPFDFVNGYHLKSLGTIIIDART
jgi:hypothetical protein